MLGPLASAEHPNRLQVAVAGASPTLQVLAALDDLALVCDGRAQEDAVHPGTRERIRSLNDVVRGIAADDQTFGWLMAVPAHVDRMLNEVLLGKS